MSRHLAALITLVVVTVAIRVPLSGSDTVVVAGTEQKPSLANHLSSLGTYSELKNSKAKPLMYAKSYLLLDAETNEVVVGNNYHTQLPIASTTKMMTALTAIDLLPLDKVVTVSSKAPFVIGSKINLRVGEKITVLSLLKGLLIYSGNDTAVALAHSYAGTDDIEPFVAKMNEKAASLGLTNTHYEDPAGLSEAGYSTAFELSQIAEVLLRNKTLAGIVATPQTTISSTDGLLTHELKSSNRLILSDSQYYMSSVLGIKTGFTLEAGHCLVAATTINGRLFIGVVLNTVESTITASASEMYKLFRFAEANVVIEQY